MKLRLIELKYNNLTKLAKFLFNENDSNSDLPEPKTGAAHPHFPML